MAFVPKTKIDEWFDESSWVFKGFSYLFQNPLWKKDVPGGFSLCPYYWLALFSICIFRPIIVPLGLFARMITVGPIVVVDNVFEKAGRKCFKAKENDSALGYGVLFLIIHSIFIVAWVVFFQWLYGFLHEGLNQTLANSMFVFALTGSIGQRLFSAVWP